jgi:hypothetical protein
MKLKLEDPIPKPSLLNGWAQKTSIEIQSWEGIVSEPRGADSDLTQVTGVNFHFGEHEIGHIHLDGEIHVTLTKELSKAIVSAKIAQPFPWGDDAMIQCLITNEKSMEVALWLFRFGYDQLRGTSDNELKMRITERFNIINH